MCIPTVEHGIWVPAQVAGRRRRHSVEQGAVGVAADHDAGLTVSRQQHAEPARVEVEGVGDRRSGEGCQAIDDLIREALETVGGVDDHVAETGLVEEGSQEILLVVVRDADGDIGRP